MRWIIDGMNVIGSRPDRWWKDRHAAMMRLVNSLELWVASSGEEVTVVFEKPPSPPISSPLVEVASAPKARAHSADDEIVRRISAERDPSSIRVVTSDHWLADQARALGASVEGSESFSRSLEA